MIRKIIQIDEEKCNGCGLCVTACHEGAIEMINGKAKLVSDEYCDGLGNCLPECPTGAIQMIEREAVAYDDDAVQERLAKMKKQPEVKAEAPKKIPCGCPGTMARAIERKPAVSEEPATTRDEKREEPVLTSELRQWPVQLNLINPYAGYLNDANLLVAADCSAFAYANFHKDFIKDHITVIGCPKLDDNEYYKEKLTEILKNSNIKSITVVRMEVPCCGGIVSAVKTAMLQSEIIVPYREVIISTDGRMIKG
ncbi:MAG: 4Fe-4S binding protein [Clostridia bacterium]|nr:4Fe-4S binding protein [Clostridia bacterium]